HKLFWFFFRRTSKKKGRLHFLLSFASLQCFLLPFSCISGNTVEDFHCMFTFALHCCCHPRVSKIHSTLLLFDTKIIIIKSAYSFLRLETSNTRTRMILQ